MTDEEAWYSTVEMSAVDQVLLPDGRWHVVERGSFRLGLREFSFVKESMAYIGPPSSILAVRSTPRITDLAQQREQREDRIYDLRSGS
jgi:hypothetical protein